jgi:hypothetical protein
LPYPFDTREWLDVFVKKYDWQLAFQEFSSYMTKVRNIGVERVHELLLEFMEVYKEGKE